MAERSGGELRRSLVHNPTPAVGVSLVTFALRNKDECECI